MVFRVEMASRTDTALDQLNLIIDARFYVKKCEPFDRYTTLQSLYIAQDHQLQDGLMDQLQFDTTRYIVRKLWELKLQIHKIEKESTQILMLPLYSEGVITRSLFVYLCCVQDKIINALFQIIIRMNLLPSLYTYMYISRHNTYSSNTL